MSKAGDPGIFDPLDSDFYVANIRIINCCEIQYSLQKIENGWICIRFRVFKP